MGKPLANPQHLGTVDRELKSDLLSFMPPDTQNLLTKGAVLVLSQKKTHFFRLFL